MWDGESLAWADTIVQGVVTPPRGPGESQALVQILLPQGLPCLSFPCPKSPEAFESRLPGAKRKPSQFITVTSTAPQGSPS